MKKVLVLGLTVESVSGGYSVLGWNHPGFAGSTVSRVTLFSAIVTDQWARVWCSPWVIWSKRVSQQKRTACGKSGFSLPALHKQHKLSHGRSKSDDGLWMFQQLLMFKELDVCVIRIVLLMYGNFLPGREFLSPRMRPTPWTWWYSLPFTSSASSWATLWFMPGPLEDSQVHEDTSNFCSPFWWVGSSSLFFFPPLSASWAVMSYPEIQSVVLDASFDDLLPLALKVMPESWSECSL